MAWPSINPPNQIRARYIKKQYKSTMETGTVISRAAWSSGKRIWVLSWNALPETDLNSLLAAFESDQGTTFSWTHPKTSVAYTVGYNSDEIEYDLNAKYYDRYQVVVELEER